jgi:hypothetical protein
MALKTFTTADGSANQALVTNGSGVLSFAAVGASAGQVIQVLGAIETTQRSTSSTSFVTASNTLSVTITPSAAANKIAIFVHNYFYSDGNACFYTIFRDSTNLGGTNGLAMFNTISGTLDGTVTYNFLDSPSTTSAITYQVYFRTSNNTGYLGGNNTKSQIIVMEIKG